MPGFGSDFERPALARGAYPGGDAQPPKGRDAQVNAFVLGQYLGQMVGVEGPIGIGSKEPEHFSTQLWIQGIVGRAPTIAVRHCPHALGAVRRELAIDLAFRAIQQLCGLPHAGPR